MCPGPPQCEYNSKAVRKLTQRQRETKISVQNRINSARTFGTQSKPSQSSPPDVPAGQIKLPTESASPGETLQIQWSELAAAQSNGPPPKLPPNEPEQFAISDNNISMVLEENLLVSDDSE